MAKQISVKMDDGTRYDFTDKHIADDDDHDENYWMKIRNGNKATFLNISHVVSITVVTNDDS